MILTGEVELAHELVVTREGFVVVPNVGRISVANLTMADLKLLLRNRLANSYSGVFVSYSAADKNRVAPLVKAIERRGWTVWWNGNIQAG